MCGSACCPFKHIAPRLTKPPPPGLTSQESNAQESSKKVATPACSVHRDDGRRREEEQVDRNVRPRGGEQHGPRAPDTAPPRVSRMVLGRLTGNAQALPPHRQGNPFGTIHHSDMTQYPHANKLNIHSKKQWLVAHLRGSMMTGHNISVP